MGLELGASSPSHIPVAFDPDVTQTITVILNEKNPTSLSKFWVWGNHKEETPITVHTSLPQAGGREAAGHGRGVPSAAGGQGVRSPGGAVPPGAGQGGRAGGRPPKGQ